jgi:hypothetical protein
MTRATCHRIWECEAAEDGRLDAAGRESFERHVDTCDACGRAVARLHELRTLLRETPTPEPTELERRRERAALLARANERTLGTSPRWHGARVFAYAGALALLLAVLVVSVRRSRPELVLLPTEQGEAAPAFEVTDVGGADYVSERVAGTSRVTLRSGTAAFHVEHVRPGARFLVALPDGEVEVRGTRFVVDVVEGHTRSVLCTEGAVAVRIGAVQTLLHAGERWQTASAETAPRRPESTLSTSAPASTPFPPHAPRVTTAAPPGARAAASAPSPSVSPPAAHLPAGVRFAEAMEAFRGGDYGEAERRLAAFTEEFPADARVEDAMFLIADVRARRGDATGARGAAREYLRRFPAGLRAPAAARIAKE